MITNSHVSLLLISLLPNHRAQVILAEMGTGGTDTLNAVVVNLVQHTLYIEPVYRLLFLLSFIYLVRLTLPVIKY